MKSRRTRGRENINFMARPLVTKSGINNAYVTDAEGRYTRWAGGYRDDRTAGHEDFPG